MKLSPLRFRRWFLVLLCVAVSGVFIARLMDIQIINAHEYRRMLEAHHVSTQTIRAVRGEIVDRNMRPITVNRMGYDVILDWAWLPGGAARNDVILRLIELCERLGIEWIDNLPISKSEPYYILPESGPAMDRLRSSLNLQPYATAEDAMFQLVHHRFGLEELPAHRQRQIAGIRYEMDQRAFSVVNAVYTFATDVPRDAAIHIMEHSHILPGVDIMESAIRHHVDGRMAPHIIGHVGPIYREELEALVGMGYAMDDIIGKAGVEQAFESVLRGINGRREIHQERGRGVIMTLESEPPIPGNTVVLTLDIDMQNILQDALRDQIYHLQATAPPGQGREANAGAAAVIDTRTGEILALATYPSYDLSTYRQDFAYLASQTTLTPLVNRALHGEYAPGSVFKPIVALAGMRAGISPTTSFPCRRNFPVGTHVFTCLGYHGHISLHRAMAVSCNIYFYEIGRRIGIDAIDHVAYMMGLGVPTGIEIPERIGQRSNPESKLRIMDEQWFEGDLIQTSIGQLLHGYTPLQLANYTATIANRGRRMDLTIVREVRDYSQQSVVEGFEFEPRVASEMTDIPPEAFEALVDSMVAASRPGGTAAMVFGWYPIDVASKTGTPETAGLPNSAFAAFAPAQEPEIAIAIIIEQGWHGFTGAPVARAVFDHHFGFTPPPAPRSSADSEPESSSTDGEQTESAAG
ncbi:MAG: penicillin-binding transpeptidase domain-containing protein [Oscillospiraceae bacterium]|nr:penicillin-binding transpeptidase domain-containing protein [Oscillospiraceae bacterium]